jgi:transitional endoplasmic reticulum ATPase
MFKKNDIINNKFEVLFSIQTTTFGSSYRVKGIEDGKIYMLKVYEKEKLNDWHFNEKGDLIEAEIHQQIDHPNISKFVACELISFQEQDLYIYVVEFISGETLQERIDREGNPNPSFATNLMKKIMSAVSYLHSFDSPIIHSDITPLNIMLDMSSGTLEPVLIDFGLSKYKQYSTFYNSSIPSIFYCAPEQFSGEYSIKSDIFSLGALYYMLLEGYFPWHNKFNISDINSVDLQEKIISNRNSKLTFTAINAIEETIKLSIVKSLLPNASSRFESVDDFYKSITKEKMISHEEIKKEEIKNVLLKKGGEGFKKVAGMHDLKQMIKDEVIDPLKDPDSFKDYGIDPPNGILFYGPPGCGKTFFAECLSEEIGFNFIKVGPSDVGSKYVHGGQEKIKQLFDSAKENAPTVLFLDEIDAMIPDRESSDIGHHYSSEVNEWLIQFNNCGEEDIFIIAATNKMDKIDSAVLRAGRFDRKILVPVPDHDSRIALFELYLEKRKKVISENINLDKLSELTENYVCSDIKLIINDASRIARKNKCKISQEIIEKIINQTSPSITSKEISKYSESKTNKNKPNSRIGFKMSSDK